MAPLLHNARMLSLVLTGVVALTAAGAPRHAKEKPPTLADVKAGDFVEYELGTDSARGTVVLRLQAAEVTRDAVIVDVRVVKGRPLSWLDGGARFLVAKGGKPPKPRAPVRGAGRDTRPGQAQRGGVTYHCTQYAFETKDGARGAGCLDSPARELALTGGLVDETEMSPSSSATPGFSVTLVAAGHADVPSPAPPWAFAAGSSWTVLERASKERLVRTAVTSTGGKVVTTRTTYEPRGGKAAPGDLALAGRTWRAAGSTQDAETLLEVLRRLAAELPSEPLDGLSGPDCTVGPRPVKTTLVPLAGKSTETRAARPAEVIPAPLPVRYGPLARTKDGAAKPELELVEWRAGD
jgi:hypothetical protein